MALTEVACKNAKPTTNARKIFDGRGLYLHVAVNGSKYWRFKYKFLGKEKILSIGIYPDISLKSAREKHDEARRKLSDGIDPSLEKQLAKQQARFSADKSLKAIALDWMEKQKPAWSQRYWQTAMTRLERNIFPLLGHRPINEIRPFELLDVARKIEARGAIDLAHKLVRTIGQIYKYARIYELVASNIADGITSELTPQRKQPNPYLLDHELPAFLAALNNYHGDIQARLATKLLLMTFLRTTELRGARWEEFNFEKAEFRVPKERMKGKMRDHIVPLAHQTIALFKELEAMNGDTPFVFPNRTDARRHMSENTILGVINRIGYKGRVTGHGFRGTASTILHEQGFNPEAIDRQLSHVKRNKISAAYDHSKHLQTRREIMQWWADFLEKAAA